MIGLPQGHGEVVALRVAVALGGVVPVVAGGAGVLAGLGMLGIEPHAFVTLDSHYRYLSGLLLGIGLAFWSTIPRIELQGGRFRLLTLLIVIGGLGRLYALLTTEVPAPPMLFGLAMELVVTPALCLWQARVAAQSR